MEFKQRQCNRRWLVRKERSLVCQVWLHRRHRQESSVIAGCAPSQGRSLQEGNYLTKRGSIAYMGVLRVRFIRWSRHSRWMNEKMGCEGSWLAEWTPLWYNRRQWVVRGIGHCISIGDATITSRPRDGTVVMREWNCVTERMGRGKVLQRDSREEKGFPFVGEDIPEGLKRLVEGFMANWKGRVVHLYVNYED